VKIVFFSFYYPPDLCAGSFRAVALVEALSKKLNSGDELHIITTHPNRYASHNVKANDVEATGNVIINRIKVPRHASGMLSQAWTFTIYATQALWHCLKIKPNFIIGTTSRLFTGILSLVASLFCRCNYYIDIRDIFSETISDILSKKNLLLGSFLKSIFSIVERQVLGKAKGVTVVSEGFLEYFQKQSIATNNWKFFPNGVDREFINRESKPNDISKKEVTRILYAGNIGSGQGLEHIIPAVAKKLGSRYRFIVIGDGGTKQLLEKKILELQVENVDLLPPVTRLQLLGYYNDADISFIHLNDLPAFKRVLPSKIFEYASLGKPIVAGLSGYSANFIKENITYARVFTPCDVDACIQSIKEAEEINATSKDVELFIEKYRRTKIMNLMADTILSIAGD